MDPIQSEQTSLSMENARNLSVLHLFYAVLFVEPSSQQRQRVVRNRYRMGCHSPPFTNFGDRRLRRSRMEARRWNRQGVALHRLSTKSARHVHHASKCSVWARGSCSPGQTGGDQVTHGSGGETCGYGGWSPKPSVGDPGLRSVAHKAWRSLGAVWRTKTRSS